MPVLIIGHMLCVHELFMGSVLCQIGGKENDRHLRKHILCNTQIVIYGGPIIEDDGTKQKE